ncbi:S-adenosyl-L-methionine-dependent methyltransferase [Mycotypha africana]|uniref:S-adenosyl-L-methionine-dependent methyltransferase n=1 Tax=Mycotypha africana TaxID=64632 RepID=UPI0022FFDA74|nr:S-adenosyl-L-methionine-dependent methyltransferase [Mycotypha africana]KAI8987620.1 S-adenosyl-L-methionine-dependent methyltransferase [Mycotypha africana]
MSPPCQPYTRVGLQQGSEDARAKSFLHLLKVLTEMKNKPKYILLENVKGFEESDSHDLLLETLNQCGYDYQEFLLTPLQLGIPNSRMRYYLLAKLKPLQFAHPVTKDIINYIPLSENLSKEFVDSRNLNDEEKLACKAASSIDPLSKFLEHEIHFEKYLVPDKVLLKNSHVFDIVKPDGYRSCCFTKGYYHYAQGTGSILQMNMDVNTEETFSRANEYKGIDDEKQLRLLRGLKLRYFSPREVANLMGFPEKFEFPASSSIKQRYRTLGNSINVKVVSELMRYLVKENHSSM